MSLKLKFDLEYKTAASDNILEQSHNLWKKLSVKAEYSTLKHKKLVLVPSNSTVNFLNEELRLPKQELQNRNVKAGMDYD